MIMKRFGLPFFAFAVLMNEAGGDGGDGGGGPAAGADDANGAPPTVTIPGAEQQQQVPQQDAKGDDVLDKAGFAAVEGDPGLTYALGFIAQNGFTAQSPSVQKALNGDFSLLKAELAQKGVQGWEQALGLAEQSWDRHVKTTEANNEKIGGIVMDIAEQLGVDWEAAAAHMGSAPQEEKDAINQLLSSPATAHIAAQFVALNFLNNGTEDVPPRANASQGGAQAAGALGAAGGPLSRREYTAEMGKLRAQLGDDYLQSSQAAALYARLQS